MSLNFSNRKFLITTFLTLVLLLGILVYFFFKINKPIIITKKYKTKGYKHLFSIYGYGKNKEEMLNHPNGVAVDKKGNIYITDQGNDRILVFNINRKFLFKFGEKGSKTGQIKSPMGIAVSSKGRIYVTDRIQNKVLIFNPKGKFIKEFKVDTPLTPVVYKNHLYITTGSKLLMYDLNGKAVANWGKRGANESEFNFPNGIAIGKNKVIYIADSNNIRIQALNLSGEAIWISGKPVQRQKNKRAFGLPVSIAIDEKNRLYVVDAFPGSIHVLNNKGEEIKKIGEYGNKDGQFNLPAQIAYAGNRVFYIADKYNNRVQAIQIP